MTDAARPWTRFYQPGCPADIDMPTTSLVEMFERSCLEGGLSPATQFFGQRTSYGELGDQVARVAEALRGLGVAAGDRVAIMLPNCPQHVVAFYAVLRLGAVVVEHNPLYTSRELRVIAEDHGAKVWIAWDSSVAKLGWAEEVGIEHIVSVNLLRAFPPVLRLALALPVPSLRRRRDALTKPAPGTIAFERLLKADPIDEAHPRPGVDDLAVIQYTSGTTGVPKGAMLTHLNLYANALQGAAWMVGAMPRREVFYAVLPMFHAFGMTLYLTYGIYKQANLVLFPTFDVDLVLQAAAKTPPTVYCAVPVIYEATAKAAKERGIDLRSARWCISGAMTLPQSTVELWESVSGGLLVEGYGMTESSPVALGNPFCETRKTGTIGIPFSSTDRRVVDPDNLDRDVAQGEPGELLISGPQVFQGYWNNPEATAETLLDGGWLRSGDLVTLDEDGFATIVDRIKEIIITGGFNVSPSEVEAVVRDYPGVADVAVIGMPRERGDEAVTAVIVPEPGASVDEAELRAWAHDQLAGYKVPRRVVIVDELPKSMLGKPLRKSIKERLLAEAAPAS